MSFLDEIAVLILTYNEEPNIGRTLDALASFPDIVVLDSGSVDATLDIVGRHKNARVINRPFDNHAAQWNHGLRACPKDRKWILALDADYQVSAALVEEIVRLRPPEDVSGYRISFRYLVYGRPLRGTLYPPVVALFRLGKGRYVQEGHTQRMAVEGKIIDLRNRIDHDDRKPLSRWFISQLKYARLERDHLLSSKSHELSWSDRIRLTGWAAPPLVFLYALFLKGCILDGWLGWLYVMQRVVVEMMIAIELLDSRVRKNFNIDSITSKTIS